MRYGRGTIVVTVIALLLAACSSHPVATVPASEQSADGVLCIDVAGNDAAIITDAYPDATPALVSLVKAWAAALAAEQNVEYGDIGGASAGPDSDPTYTPPALASAYGAVKAWCVGQGMW
jgi:hypothetical protein